MKKIYKYPTGAEIPDGAVYLGTATQREVLVNLSKGDDPNCKFRNSDTCWWEKCWLVWHYFLVEVDNPHTNDKE